MSLVLSEPAGPVLWITINRPETRNALNREALGELSAALTRAREDQAVRVVALTGTPPAFCAGGDLKEIVSDPATAQDSLGALRGVLEAIVTLPQPTIAAVNGPALGGGAGLVTACDFAYAAESAVIGYPETEMGFVAALVSVLLVRKVPPWAARELLLGGAAHSAEEAFRLRIVNGVVSDGGLRGHVQARGEALATKGPRALAVTKSLLETMPRLSLSEGLDLAERIGAEVRAGEEFQQRAKAYLERLSKRR
jgi:methylglutaconyl-CoA hydratase